MRNLITIVCSCLVCAYVQAQDTSFIKYSDRADSSEIVKNYNTQLDSLVDLWYVKKSENLKFSDVSKKHYDSTYVPKFTNKEYRTRIEQMNSVVKLTYNDKVQNYIDVYANKRRNSVSAMLGMAEYYFPIFEDIFEQYDVPQELKYLSIIESALNPKAKSPAGARGIWQFMPTTARNYKLKVNSYLDERCDPIKSTHAAAQYLKALNDIFGDWVLAIAAYNCGPGNIKKAIARSGGKTDFWDIYNFLPKETRSYVPAFIAAYYVFENHELHNLYPKKIVMPKMDTIMVSKKLHFKQISEVLKVPLEELEDLNPQYKADVVPYSEEGSPLYLPIELVSPFLRLKDSIYAHKDSVYLNLQPERTVASKSTSTVPASSGRTKTYYTVKAGDTYTQIAKRYGVSVNTLKSWNHRTSNMLHIGEKLVVYAPSTGKGSSASKPSVSQNNTQKTSQTTANSRPNSGNKAYHVVKSGDTLWSISQRYGTTVDHIKSLNGLTSTKLSLGMNLRVQ